MTRIDDFMHVPPEELQRQMSIAANEHHDVGHSWQDYKAEIITVAILLAWAGLGLVLAFSICNMR